MILAYLAALPARRVANLAPAVFRTGLLTVSARHRRRDAILFAARFNGQQMPQMRSAAPLLKPEIEGTEYPSTPPARAGRSLVLQPECEKATLLRPTNATLPNLSQKPMSLDDENLAVRSDNDPGRSEMHQNALSAIGAPVRRSESRPAIHQG